MVWRFGLVTAATLGLCGCQLFSATVNTDAKALAFNCDDGRHVWVTYPNADMALLTIDQQHYTLHVSPSADGVRYVGGGWQWWTKGMHDGALSLLSANQTIASARGVECHAN